MVPRWVIGLCAFGTCGAQVSAQTVPAEGRGGIPIFGLTTGREVFRDCVTDLDVSPDVPVVDLGCSVAESVPLGAASGAAAWMLRYRRVATQDYEEFIDTLSIDEFVLVRQLATGRFEAIWRLSRDRTYEFLEDVRFAAKDRGTLVSYLICLNGTGGCEQRFLYGGPGGWTEVDQSFRDALLVYVPEGWSIHKGRRIDVTTLRGVQPIVLPTDANCCPSGAIAFTVELWDRDLRLVSATIGGDP